ncbi:MAG: preprotein translocase subunit SecF [Candidatus Endobugula sp.]|jgi:preprotein translocase subunit SecF
MSTNKSKNKHSTAANTEHSAMVKSINFMSQRYVAIAFSALLLIASISSLAINGLKFGLDFTGGLQIEPQYSQSVNLQEVRTVLADNGFKDAVVVNFGSDRDLKITIQQSREELVIAQLAAEIDAVEETNVAAEIVSGSNDPARPNGALVLTFVNANDNLRGEIEFFVAGMGLKQYQVSPINNNQFTLISAEGLQVFTETLLIKTLSVASGSDVLIKRTEFVGPQVGDELRDDGGIGMLFALAIVMAYVALRFQFKFSVASVAALIHDVIIVLGFFSVFALDFDLTVLAAVLAVIGYSLNDTIVVSDRIRENFRLIRTADAIEIINVSLTQTLGRTLVTSLTTLLVLLALFFVGGELIHSFSIALIIGVFVGTYSSVYVAANILLFMNITKEDLMPPVKEGAEIDDMP